MTKFYTNWWYDKVDEPPRIYSSRSQSHDEPHYLSPELVARYEAARMAFLPALRALNRALKRSDARKDREAKG